MVKTEQIGARIDQASLARIRSASAVRGVSVSAFIVDAACREAEEVIEAYQGTLVPSDYFDALLAALDQPPTVIPELAAVAQAVSSAPVFEQD